MNFVLVHDDELHYDDVLFEYFDDQRLYFWLYLSFLKGRPAQSLRMPAPFSN